ncbi:SGNH/GDSL hydrolase family protein [Tsukamurella sp. 1534]|uniref:SGNH/GDSL hydrolase family protein n=1 Tax=Tsukamurella sp. 1534 TaxID=1151061 RepID=UPI000301CB06|nr:SGNH/GDSL hydrolase family protein [Tsukamurella sp. 1534]
MPRTLRATAALLVVCLVALVVGASTAIGGGSGYIHYQSNGRNYIPDLPGGGQYVSMGDSYAASGSLSKRYALDFCSRNSDDLGHVLAQRLQPNTFTDRACSGASLDDLTQLSWKPQSSPQIYGVGPFTRLVTVIAGANSLGFGGVITRCFTDPGVRTEAACREEVERNLPGTQGWNFVRAQYAATIDAIRKAGAPDMRLLMVGYLPLFPAEGEVDPACLAAAEIPQWSVPLWRTWYDALQRMVKEVAADRGAIYIDPPVDHPACSPDPYVALRGATIKGEGPDSFGLHPTVLGQRALGNLIEDRLRGLARPA